MSRGFVGGALVSVAAACCIAAGVKAEQRLPGAATTYLVQLTGPVLDTWKTALVVEGAELQEYVPHFAFRVRMDPDEAARVRRLDFVASVSPLRAEDRLARGLVRNGRRLYVARLDRDADVPAVASALRRAGVQVLRRGPSILMLVADGAQLGFVAAVDGIAAIDDFAPRVKHNEYGGGAIIGGNATNTSGYDGSTQTIAISDTGLGSGTAATAHAGIASSRIASIFNWPGVPDFCFETITNDGAADVDSGHGTHVATAALGAGDPGGVGRGTAPAASLVFQAIENYAVPSLICSLLYGVPDGYYLVGIPDDVGDLFDQGYQQGARVHSNSWGAEVAGAYNADAANTDAFLWAHRDMAIAFSAGNSGTDTDFDGVVDLGSINSPGTAKNVITVGASENDRQSHWECDSGLSYTTCAAQGGQNSIFSYGAGWPDRYAINPLRDDPSAGNAEQLAAFSSRGPTADGRIKPDVVAPGTWTLSGYSDAFQQQYDASPNPVNGSYQYDGWGFPFDASYKYMGGTSMAAPLVAGGAAVVRDFYHKARGHQASAALVKAALVNSAVDLLDENNDGALDNANPIPNPHEGWGRIDLAAATDGTDQFFDETSPLSTGSTSAYTVDVAPAGVALKATLVWTDYPASTSSAISLVNDLDLTVVAPDGTTYHGNAFAGGWSVPGGAPDRVNNVENVFVFSAAAGTWTVTVAGYNVPNGPQPFALVLDVPSPAGSAPIVRATVDDGTATEAGPTGGVIRFTRSGDTSAALTVTYSVGGSAVPGSDFVALAGSATIPEGAIDVAVAVDALDDTLYEGPESVVLTVMPEAAYVAGSPASATVTITSDDLPPDLGVSALTVPALAAAGAVISVTDTTRNQGTGLAPVSETGFYWSTNSTWDSSDEWLGSRPVSTLGAGATETHTSSIAIPAGTAARTYYLIAKADWSGSVAESLENNNTRASTVKVGPDLLVTALSAPSTATAGQTLQVTDTTKNQGAGGTGPTTTSFFLSSNTMLDALDVALGSRAVGALGGGLTSTASTLLTIPPATSVGAYYVLAQADGGEVEAEYLETNNVRASVVRIGADLVVSALTGPSKAGAGEVISVIATTTNSGAAEAAASATLFYWSSNSTLDVSDTLLGSQAVPVLAGTASHAATLSLSIPPGAATGTYLVIAKADGLEAHSETIETNNVKTIAVSVGPDLMVTAVDTPATGAAGGMLTVTDSTRNGGGGESPESRTDFYISSNASLDAADVWLGARTVPALAAQATSSGSSALVVPSGTASGTYYVIAKADAPGGVTEVLETNNLKASVPVRIGPDLLVPSLTVPSSVARGVAFNVTDTTRNDGGAATGMTTTTYYLSTNTSLDGSDLFLGSRSVSGLAPGASEAGQASVTVPAGQATGIYYLIAKADGPNALAESIETNNTRARSLRVDP